MMPWEKYASAATAPAPEAGPWTKYAGAPVETPAEPAKTPEPSLLDKAKGVGEAGLALASGIPATLAGQVYGVGKTLTGGKYGTQAGAAEGEAAGVDLANKLTYQPKTATGKDYLERVGSGFENSKLAGLPVEGSVLSQIPKVPKAAGAAARAVGEDVGDVSRAAGRGAAGAVASALPKVDPETAQLARDAHAMGFRLTPDQVVGGKYSKALGEGVAHVPLSGSNIKHNSEVFTRNVADLAGVEGGKLTRKGVDAAYDKWGRQEIGGINAKYPVPMDRAALQALKSNAAGELPEVQGVVNHYTNLVKTSLVDGILPGKTFRKLNTEIGTRIRTTTNGDLKNALGNLQEDLLDRQRAAITDPTDQARLDTARKHYAILKTIEPLAAKSTTGDIPPGALLGALTATKAGKARVARGAAGDLGKLADIGQRFLKEAPSSGTAERRWAQSIPSAIGGLVGAGGAAAGAGPAAGAGLLGAYGLANAYNRLGPSVTQRMIDRPPR